MVRRFEQATRLIDKDKSVEAIPILHELLDELPDEKELRYVMGLAQYNSGHLGLALEHLTQAVSMAPDNPDWHTMLGLTLMRLGEHEQAITAYQTALKLDPHNVHAQTSLAELLYTYREDWEGALEILEKVVEQKPSHHPAHLRLALTLNTLERTEEALEHGYKAIKLAPRESSYYLNVGDIQQKAGNIEEAERLLERAWTLNPALGGAYHGYTRTHKFSDQDRGLVRKMEQALELSMSLNNRDKLHYALGKAYNDLKEWDKAFSHYQQANSLVHDIYDDRAVNREMRDIRRVFTSSFFKRYAEGGNQSEAPVFIIGMPRSGSTLVDQILSSHPQVHSVGESPEISRLVGELCAGIGNGQKFPFCLQQIKSSDMEEFAERYLAKVFAGQDSGITRVVDKQLFNDSYLGIIALAFPNAKIIHTRRNPLDTCLSCYFQRFTERLSWTFNLNDCGLYYRVYRQNMSHWQKSLPFSMLEVDYEAVVEDVEASARRILEFCDLEWDPQVLAFHELKRTVQTSSLGQVRQNIYKTSKKRWKNYAPYLQPLVDGLGEYVEEDREELELAGLKVKKSYHSIVKRMWRR